jgi:hypothetical protein
VKKRVEKFRRWPYRYLLYGIGFILLVIFSNLYLQWCQNNLSVDLAFKFAFSWHTEKFFLGCFVLSVFLLFLCSLAGSLGVGALLYSVIIGVGSYVKTSDKKRRILFKIIVNPILFIKNG